MNTVSILGNFNLGSDTCSGQIIKTRMISEEVKKHFDDVLIADTAGGLRFIFKMPFVIFSLLRKSKNIIIMPAQNGIHLIPLVLIAFNVFFHRRLHYIVIGGWLPDFLRRYWHLRLLLKRIDRIYVETANMQRQIARYGITDAIVMSNCKSINILTENDIERQENIRNDKPLRLCTFSRVMKEKGIEDAVKAVIECNIRLQTEAFALDIYGEVISGQHKWFEDVMRGVPHYISHKGQIGYKESTKKLQAYYMLLFPTFYSGEGHAGTLIDALASGLPVVATDWHDNASIITDGKTGFITPAKDYKSMADKLVKVYQQPELIKQMRLNCIKKAQEYLPKKIIAILINEIQR